MSDFLKFLQAIFPTVKSVFIAFDILLFFAVVFIFLKVYNFLPKFIKPMRKSSAAGMVITAEKEFFTKQWKLIIEKIEQGQPHYWTLAVVDADKLVDEAMKRMGLPGEHFADRLSNIDSADVKSVEKLWRVHRIRNDIAHLPGFSLSKKDSEEILSVYRDFLMDVSLLD